MTQTVLARVRSAVPETLTMKQFLSDPALIANVLPEVGIQPMELLDEMQAQRAKLSAEIEALKEQGALVDTLAWDLYADWYQSTPIPNGYLSKLVKDGKVVKVGNLWSEFVDAKQRADETAKKITPEIAKKERYLRNFDERITVFSSLMALGAIG